MINKFTQPKKPRDDSSDVPRIFVRLPYIGRPGERLVKKTVHKLLKCLTKPVNFVVISSYARTSYYLSMKDFISKELSSDVIYKFTCPGCKADYIGKTERWLNKRTNEHGEKAESEINKHIHDCEGFKYLIHLAALPTTLNENSTFKPCVNSLILQNTRITDKANHWSTLLLKEAYYIHKLNPMLNHGLKDYKQLALFA